MPSEETPITVGAIWSGPPGTAASRYRVEVRTARLGKRVRVRRLSPPSLAGKEIMVSREQLLAAYVPEVPHAH